MHSSFLLVWVPAVKLYKIRRNELPPEALNFRYQRDGKLAHVTLRNNSLQHPPLTQILYPSGPKPAVGHGKIDRKWVSRNTPFKALKQAAHRLERRKVRQVLHTAEDFDCITFPQYQPYIQ